MGSASAGPSSIAPVACTALFLGLSLLSWTVGDVVLTTQSVGGAAPPSPSLADVFYIGFYPFALVAVVFSSESRPAW